MDPKLLRQGGDRFRSRHFSTRGMDRFERDVRVDGADGRFDHQAALVRLGDDPIGAHLRYSATARRAHSIGEYFPLASSRT